MKFKAVAWFLFAVLMTTPLRSDEPAPDVESQKNELTKAAARAGVSEDFEQVAEHCEALVRLDPDNKKYRTDYADAVDRHFEAVFFGWDPPPADKARQALKLYARAMDLTEELPITGWYEDVSDRMHLRSGNAWRSIRSYKQELYPGWKAELRAIQERIVPVWREAWDVVREAGLAEDPATEYEWSRREALFWMLLVFDHTAGKMPPDLSAPLYEIVFRDFMKYSRELNPPWKEYGGLHRRAYSYFLTDLARMTGGEIDGTPETIEKTKQILLGILDDLENDDRPFFQIRGWYARQTLAHPCLGRAFTSGNDRSAEATGARQNLYEAIKAKIASLPPEWKPEIYEFLYRDAESFATGAPHQSSYELMDLALSRNDAPSLFYINFPRNRENALRSLEYIDRAVAVIKAESGPEGRYTADPDHSIYCVTQLVDQIKKQAGVDRGLVAPWKSVARLLPEIDAKADRTLYGQPSMFGDWYFVFEFIIREGRVRWHGVNLKTNEKSVGPYAFIAESGELDEETMGLNFAGGIPIERRYYCSFVDERNLYLGTKGHGLLVFPRDGGEPRRLSSRTGPVRLPNDIIQGVGAIGGKIYLGLGERHKGESRLVRVDLETKTIDLLASNMLEPDDLQFSPDALKEFCDLEHVPFFHQFQYDVKRNRLLFNAGHSLNQHPPVQGLWSIDGRSGEIRQLHATYQEEIYWSEIRPGGDTLLSSSDRWSTILFDLKNDTAKLYCADLTGEETSCSVLQKELRQEPILDRRYNFGMMSEVDGWVYGHSRWGGGGEKPSGFFRVERAKPARVEMLELPTEKSYFFSVLSTPDGKGFIATDPHNVWFYIVKE